MMETCQGIEAPPFAAATEPWTVWHRAAKSYRRVGFRGWIHYGVDGGWAVFLHHGNWL